MVKMAKSNPKFCFPIRVSGKRIRLDFYIGIIFEFLPVQMFWQNHLVAFLTMRIIRIVLYLSRRSRQLTLHYLFYFFYHMFKPSLRNFQLKHPVIFSPYYICFFHSAHKTYCKKIIFTVDAVFVSQLEKDI